MPLPGNNVKPVNEVLLGSKPFTKPLNDEMFAPMPITLVGVVKNGESTVAEANKLAAEPEPMYRILVAVVRPSPETVLLKLPYRKL